MPSPVGPLVLAGCDGVLTNLRMTDQTHPPEGRANGVRTRTAFPDAVDQLDAYFAGELTEFDIEMRLDGTDFQQHVWRRAGRHPLRRDDAPTESSPSASVARAAARAVGLANGHNPIAIIVPCHRVIGANGSLTGYGGGLERKQALLALEGGQLAFDAVVTRR